ncbi:hypothetical protein NKH49_26945 [Mesorhizobium sp. M1088]|uniref:hypothetical protein n=1 Tax=Mesorhizobium sp. M1088 TaxID=2957056 RepID=UPI00333CAEEC
MVLINKIIFAGFLALVLSQAAYANIRRVPYAQKVIRWNAGLDAISAGFQLSDQNKVTLKTAALQWIFVGPCEGSVDKLGADGGSVIQFALGADPTQQLYSAFFSMIGYLSTDNLGRKPTDEMCRFAFELGASPR